MPLRQFHEPKSGTPQPPLDVRSITLPEQTEKSALKFDASEYLSPEYLRGLIAELRQKSSEELLRDANQVHALMILAPQAEVEKTFLAKVSWPEVIERLNTYNERVAYTEFLENMAWINPLETRKYLEDNWEEIDLGISSSSFQFLMTLKICWPEKFNQLTQDNNWDPAAEAEADFKVGFALLRAMSFYAYRKLLWPEKMAGIAPDEHVLQEIIKDFNEIYVPAKKNPSQEDSLERLFDVADMQLINFDDIKVIDGKVRLIKKTETVNLEPLVPPQPANLDL